MSARPEDYWIDLARSLTDEHVMFVAVLDGEAVQGLRVWVWSVTVDNRVWSSCVDNRNKRQGRRNVGCIGVSWPWPRNFLRQWSWGNGGVPSRSNRRRLFVHSSSLDPCKRRRAVSLYSRDRVRFYRPDKVLVGRYAVCRERDGTRSKCERAGSITRRSRRRGKPRASAMRYA